ncbi:MAG: nitroreductase family protein [Ileibacterium sp.]|nr:nitroreductase family protein [Ileibacterium sp.]
MKFEHVLKERRSIRRYLDDPVSEEDVKSCLKAALLAPSWKNSETMRFYVVTSDTKLAEMKENCLPPFNAKNCANAPVLIVTAFQKGQSGFNPDGTPTNEIGEGWGFYDLGLATENLCLQAQALGLGTLIMGIRNEAAIRTMLEVPEDEIIVSVISLGRPDIEPPKPTRKKVKEIAKFF